MCGVKRRYNKIAVQVPRVIARWDNREGSANLPATVTGRWGLTHQIADNGPTDLDLGWEGVGDSSRKPGDLPEAEVTKTFAGKVVHWCFVYAPHPPLVDRWGFLLCSRAHLRSATRFIRGPNRAT